MKNLLTSIPLAILFAVVALAAAGQVPSPRVTGPIVFVSAQRIFAESSDGKAQVARVQALQQQRATELRTRQQTLDATRQQLAQAVDVAARAQLQQQELQQRTDFERATAQAQTDLQNLQRQVQAELQGRVKSALDDVTKGQNIQLVLNADSSVVWSAPGTDLTNAVVERLNSRSATVAPQH